MNNNQKTYIDSEKYRQMLVKDGEKRFQEWHNKFIKYQEKFIMEMSQNSVAQK